MDKSVKIGAYVVTFLVGMLGGIKSYKISSPLVIPNVTKVETYSVVPSKLEIECEDLDRDGIPETYVGYDGKRYMFNLDESGKPVIQEYFVEPAKIISK
ncbi:hypothetical protein J4438_02005 [Candidatus Woesearchaeota archaeon]|nr:hypothetical protein [Candidatus Woesearchaeota archaeon]